MSDMLQHRTLRLRFAASGSLTKCSSPVLLSKIISVFESAGIQLAMGSEKRPKPIAQLAYPLPLGVEGLEEWADVTLAASLNCPLDTVLGLIRQCSPKGLSIYSIEQVPLHASSIAELCETAHWLWLCPEALFQLAKQKMEYFINSESFQINKAGKVEGKKSTKSIEVRHLVDGVSWENKKLRFSTKIVQGQALSPQKLIGGILDIGLEHLGTFIRERITLKHDPKLERHDKYAIKLRNLYEDAVLLESAPNISAYGDNDDDDDDDDNDNDYLIL
jgi:radical SAM-linked protein